MNHSPYVLDLQCLILPEIPLQQSSESLAVTGFVAGHLRGFASPGYALYRWVLSSECSIRVKDAHVKGF